MVDTPRYLAHGRESYRRRAWVDAHRFLQLADETTPLGAEDLELLAVSAYLLSRDHEAMPQLRTRQSSPLLW